MSPIPKILLFLALLLCCGQLQSQNTSPNAKPKQSRKAKKAIEASQRQNILSTAKRFIGSKYKYGGNKPNGFDCSGFVEYVYSKNSIEVPRVCKEQLQGAKKKRVSKLKPGDLVFFGKWKVKHVGIVLLSTSEELVIIHSSSSKGVSITNVFDSTYWKRRLKGGGTYFK